MLSKNSHLRHNHFYLLIFINFIFLMNFALLSLSLFFRRKVIDFYPGTFLPGQS
ncbi:hypothetical protein NI35_2964 [Salmonella enterica subsp. enterica serovar Cerro]|nr:hypothetical protein GW13_PRO0315 [Salmonella enterica subsp. enterica serovar Cerro]KMN25398.1 hypothetical protein NI35_2964 [Salmonella enterica subsp. enterica serovar Cerro]